MQEKGRGLNRRDFIIKSVAGAGLLAAFMSPMKILTNQAKAARTVPGTSSARSWSMVVDLRKCDGCTGLDLPPQCTQACIADHYVPKGMHWIEVFQINMESGGTYFQPTPCMHCDNAPCVNVCPVAATYQTEEGIVLIDQRRCIGCRMCLAACPYQRRFFNWGAPEQPAEAKAMKYSPERQVPAYRGTAMKCDFCPDLLHSGKPPACVTGCPRKVLYMADRIEDIASNGKEVVRLSHFLSENNAYHLKEELGTQPKVWYIPGHGEAVGRHSDDPTRLKPSVWNWGGEGYNKKVGIWPWGEVK